MRHVYMESVGHRYVPMALERCSDGLYQQMPDAVRKIL